MSIQRYDLWQSLPAMVEDDDGDYVKFADHEAGLAAKNIEIGHLRDALEAAEADLTRLRVAMGAFRP